MNELQLPDSTQPDRKSAAATAPDTTLDKPAFIEPEISAPVDVLEATTFFQAATSGGTN